MEQISPQGPSPPPADRRHVEILFLALAALVLWKLAGVLLLLFTAVIMAAALTAVADGMRRLAPVPRSVAVFVAAVLIFGTLVGVTALFGWRILAQYEVILGKVRESAHMLLVYARAHDWSQSLLQRANGAQISDATDTLAPLLGTALGATARYLTYAVIVVACSIFLALHPDRYSRGALLLVPPARRALAADFLTRSGLTLKRWLVSRLIVMIAVGVLASIGLKSLGIAGAFTLGLTGGLLTFVPFIGALMAAAPAVLVALTISPTTAVVTGLMFWGVHFVEGTFITPLVQDEEVDLPPVLTIFATLGFTVIFGPSGVFLASPLVLIIIVALRVFYLEDQLGERIEPIGARPRRWALFGRSRVNGS